MEKPSISCGGVRRLGASAFKACGYTLLCWVVAGISFATFAEPSLSSLDFMLTRFQNVSILKLEEKDRGKVSALFVIPIIVPIITPPNNTTNIGSVDPIGGQISTPNLNLLIPSSCGDFQTVSTSYGTWLPTASGCGVVTANSAVRIGLFIPAAGGGTVSYCGFGSVTFPVSASTPYTIIVDGGYTTSSNVIPCVPVLGLSGNLAFGGVQVGSTATATLTVTNSGLGTLQVANIAFPPAFTGSWNNGSIPPGGHQDIVVTFAPTSLGDYAGTVVVTSNATTGSGTVAISGTGLARIVALTGSLGFGNVQVGSSATATLRVTNSGNETLNVGSFTFPAGFSGDWNGGAIAPGGFHDVVVTFSPTTPSSYGGSVTVASDEMNPGVSIPISGTGVARILALSGNLAFGSLQIGSSATATLRISNSGNQTLTVTGLLFPPGFSGNWNNGPVAPSGSRDVIVTFSPSSVGNFGGTVTVNSDATSGASSYPISGTGSAAPTRVVGLSGNLAFGNVQIGSSATATLHISNSGNQTLNVTGLIFPPGFSGNLNNGSIAPGGSRDVIVTFAPTTAVDYAGTLTVNCNATDGINTYRVSGTGSAKPTRVVVLSGNLLFGSVQVGASQTTTLRIANSGNSPLNVSGLTVSAGFTANWSSGIIAPGASQDVTVTFSPASAGSYSGVVTVTSDATSGQGTIAISGNGVAVASTRVIDLQGNLDFGRVRVGTLKTKTLTIANHGTSTLNISGVGYPLGFGGNWLGGAIAPGTAQVVQVSFYPTAAATYGGTIKVISDATSGGNTLPVSGLGLSIAFTANDLQRPSGGKFHLTFSGEPGKISIIESSSDLVHWNEVARLSGSDHLSYDDQLPGGSSRRYYRFRDQ